MKPGNRESAMKRIWQLRSINVFSSFSSATSLACMSIIIAIFGFRVGGSIYSSVIGSRSRQESTNERERDRLERKDSLQVLYLDNDYCVVNKPCDVRMDGEGFDTTVQGLVMEYLNKISRPIATIRFAHRLDYATSGCLCVALNKKAAARAGHIIHYICSLESPSTNARFAAGDLFASRDAQKQYLALAYGHVREEGYIIDAPVAEYIPDISAGEERMRPTGIEDTGRDFRMTIGTPANPGRTALTEVLPPPSILPFCSSCYSSSSSCSSSTSAAASVHGAAAPPLPSPR